MYRIINNLQEDGYSFELKYRGLLRKYNKLESQYNKLQDESEYIAYQAILNYTNALKKRLEPLMYSSGVDKKYMLTRHAESDANELLHEFVPKVIDETVNYLFEIDE